jgi:hypothetical protein
MEHNIWLNIAVHTAYGTDGCPFPDRIDAFPVKTDWVPLKFRCVDQGGIFIMWRKKMNLMTRCVKTSRQVHAVIIDIPAGIGE